MTPEQSERWKTTRQLGRKRYILVTGVIAWGLTAGIGWAIFMSALQGWDKFIIYLPVALIGFPIGGYFYGAWMWKKMEAEFEKASNRNR